MFKIQHSNMIHWFCCTVGRGAFFLFTVAGITGCSDLKKHEENFPTKDATEWITYEGRVKINDSDFLIMELAMASGNPGEGSYTLREWLKTDAGTQSVGSFKGSYTTFSTPSGTIDIHFHNSAYPSGIKHTYKSLDGKRIREEEYRSRDLVLRKDGDHRLIALDNANEPISLESDENLSKRTSIVFTVEGTFAHLGDSSVFYETNTGHVWSVAKQGEYYLATTQYHQLTGAKNDGVYLKGTGFSIHHTTAAGKEKEMLVFKKIIGMSAAQQSE
jgi:hypothetical protein